jgi:DNA-binding CsgD family transcriptional regulator
LDPFYVLKPLTTDNTDSMRETSVIEMRMALEAHNSRFAPSAGDVNDLFTDRDVSGAILDRRGTIVDVSSGWKSFASDNGLQMPNFGVGQNYLSYCTATDQESLRIVQNISDLQSGQIDFLCFVYPCHSPSARRWFLLIGFPHPKGRLTTLLHINITDFLPLVQKRKPVVLMDQFGTALLFTAFFKNRDAAYKTGLAGLDTGSAPLSEKKLSKRQCEVLALIARGKSNKEIADELAISEATVKAYTTAILRSLGVSSRTQAAFKARTNFNS